jgi:hypothetical protein
MQVTGFQHCNLRLSDAFKFFPKVTDLKLIDPLGFDELVFQVIILPLKEC